MSRRGLHYFAWLQIIITNSSCAKWILYLTKYKDQLIMSLSKTLKLAVSIFNDAPFNVVSTIDFRRGGIYYPAQVISQLRTAGAIISVVKKAAYNEAGELCQNIAHYCLVGWA